MINAPRCQFHTYKNIGKSAGKLLLIITPPHFEKFFEEIGIPIDDRSSFKPQQIIHSMIEDVIKTASRYGLKVRT